MRKLLLLTICFLPLFLIGCGDKQSQYKKGLESYKTGLYTEAVSCYEQAISMGEDSALIYAEAALAYEKLKQTDTADRYMEKALASAPQDPAVLVRKGNLFEERNLYEDAMAAYRESIAYTEKEEETYEAKGYLAALLYFSGEYEEAVELYNALIRGDYYKTEHYLLAGSCYVHLNQLSAAASYFDYAILYGQMTPENYLYIYNLCRETENFYDSEQYFNKGLEALRAAKKPSISIGRYYALAGKSTVAIKYLETSHEADDLLSLCGCYFLAGEYDKSEACCKELIQKGENLPFAYNRYLMICIQKGDMAMARQTIQTIHSFGNDTATSYADWNEILLLEAEGEYDRAYQKLQLYARTYPFSVKVQEEIQFLSRLYY